MATLPLTGVEVLYPIQQAPSTNRLVHNTDAQIPKVVSKTQTSWRQEKLTLEFRIKSENMGAFIAFLEANFGVTITLNVPGIQPFIRSGASHTAWIVDWSTPQRELEKHWRMNVTFLREIP